ncbi:hypothetical protein N657DRAFT_474147 [Parathielavia appendiculata]|uniref:Uncharacterized protein n=1 Tax=Parathielavia appendiculata TaxID=2587402 RepID=A0AAN6TY44_9PEZI|nr:hypothetical protein N657DRAFT_474147 [Parathielavia appendiculata]
MGAGAGHYDDTAEDLRFLTLLIISRPPPNKNMKKRKIKDGNREAKRKMKRKRGRKETKWLSTNPQHYTKKKDEKKERRKTEEG